MARLTSHHHSTTLPQHLLYDSHSIGVLCIVVCGSTYGSGSLLQFPAYHHRLLCGLDGLLAPRHLQHSVLGEMRTMPKGSWEDGGDLCWQSSCNKERSSAKASELSSHKFSNKMRA